MASPGRIELPASRLGGARSIHLSYGDGPLTILKVRGSRPKHAFNMHDLA